MEVRGLMVDPTSSNPIVVLRDLEGQIFLPIWIGVFEANAIALRLEGVEPPRPMTHDLLNHLIDELEATVEAVVINDLREGTFFAQIHLQQGGRDVTVDARPSDAIALALRAEAAIYVVPDVLDRAKTVAAKEDETEEERLRRLLEEVDPNDLGKYTM
jgi:bifunctional DNase/RNase